MNMVTFLVLLERYLQDTGSTGKHFPQIKYTLVLQ